MDCFASLAMTAARLATRETPRSSTPQFATQRVIALLGVIIVGGEKRPDARGQPADHGQLQDEADDPAERLADREEGQPGQEQSDQITHVQTSLRKRAISGIASSSARCSSLGN